MPRWTVIAWDEIDSRRRLLWMALGVGISAPLIELAMPGALDRGWVGLGASLSLGLAVALLLGAGLFYRPLVEGRLGFYFSQPIRAGALWWGKLSGTSALALAVVLVAFLPTFLVDRAALRADGVLGVWLGVALALPVLVAVANFAALALRMRSEWTPWTLLSAGAAIAGGLLALRYLAEIEALRARGFAVAVLGTAVGGAIVGGGLAAVTRGRTEIRAAHRALARVALACAGGAAGVAVVAALWLRVEGIRHLQPDAVWSSRSGELVFVQGTIESRGPLGWLRHRNVRLVMPAEPESSAYRPWLQVPNEAWCMASSSSCAITMADDGDLVVWAERGRRAEASWCLWGSHLDGSPPAPELAALREGALCFEAQPKHIDLSPDDEHALVEIGEPGRQKILVVSTRTGDRELLPNSDTARGWNVPCWSWGPGPATLSLCQPVQNELRWLRVDLAAARGASRIEESIEELGRFAAPRGEPLVVATSRDGKRLLIGEGTDQLSLYDDRGDIVQRIELPAYPFGAMLYHDGVLALLGGGREAKRLMYWVEGHPEPRATLETQIVPAILAELSPGRLLVRRSSPGVTPPDYGVFDVDTGALEAPPEWLRGADAPILGPPSLWGLTELETLQQGNPQRILGVRTDGLAPVFSIVDLTTGETEPLFRR